MNQGINAKVLVVDDEKTVRDFLVRFLKFESIEVTAVENGFQAIEAVKTEKFDLVFLDIKMPGIDGIRTYAELRKIEPAIQCVFMTGYALEEGFIDKINQQGQGVICLKKPFQDINFIKNIVCSLLGNSLVDKKDAPDISERRIYQRLDIILEGTYKVISRETGVNGFFIKNISPGGVKILLPEALSVGIMIELLIQFMDNKTCKVTAMVIWSKESLDKVGFYETGVNFTQINLSELADCLGSSISFSAKRKAG